MDMGTQLDLASGVGSQHVASAMSASTGIVLGYGLYLGH